MSTIAFIKNLQGNSINHIKQRLKAERGLAEKIVTEAEEFKVSFSVIPELEDLVQKFKKVADPGANAGDVGALRTAFGQLNEQLCGMLKTLEAQAYQALKVYLEALKRYCETLLPVSGANARQDRELLDYLESLDPDKLISYIISGTGADLKDLTPLVRLLHTEPMLISLNKTAPHDYQLQFFYTRKDMCKNCRKVVNEFAQQNKSHIVVLSRDQGLLEGQIGGKTTVDRDFASSELRHGRELSNVYQIRLSQVQGVSPEQVTVLYSDIHVNFDDPVLVYAPSSEGSQ